MSLLKKILEILLRRKIVLISFLVVLGAVLILFFLFQKEASLRVGKEGAESGFINLKVEVPSGAFGKQKVLKITRISGDERRKYSDAFIGDLYRVEFADGVNEFALKPIHLKYYFDSQYFRGENYNNLALAYATDDGGYRVIPGSMIGKDERGYFVEAFTYHLSVFGLVMKTAGFQKHGVTLLREMVTSPAPAVLIVPGEDPTFKGSVGDGNIWEAVFPDRTLMIYEYALYDSRSLSYSEAYREFVRKEGRRSFIDFEADFLSKELLELSRYDFDILAHGTGGLIVLRMLQRHPEVGNVRRVVLFSTPVRGTNVVNPLYFSSMFFEKDPEVLSGIFGVEWTKLKMMTLHIRNLIDTLGEVALEILPDSSLIRQLENFNGKDVEIFSICGDTPPYGVDVSGTELEKFYPEFVKENGDGFVSIQSCRIGKTLQLKGSFYDLYSQRENLSRVEELLGYETPVFSGFKDDSYREYLPVQNPEISSESLSPQEEKVEVEKKVFPQKFLSKNFLRRVRSLTLSSYTAGSTLGKDVYVATGSGVLMWDREMFKGSVKFFKKVNDYISFLSKGDIYLIDRVGISRYAPFPVNVDVEDALITKDAILYAQMVPGGVRYYLFEDGKEKLLATSPGIGVSIKEENGRYLLLSSKEIIVLDEDFAEKERVLSSLFGDGADIVDGTFVDDALYILLSDGSVAYVSGEKLEMGHLALSVPVKILRFQEKIFAIGENEVIDVTEGVRQSFTRKIVDAFAGEEGIFIVFEEKVGVSLEEWRVEG
ncbi:MULTISPECIES: hypothetical protein [Thermotoga]|jgi:hypothetical protein|uniref:Alpha/beta hydrolase n=2 Tax=Thermotoga neapolitana TaxID=2337 RepID=B9K6W8_THENN|nr:MULTISPECIES: hypothetical protein [Thermotoga]MDK2785602.1 hypothetical protein [Thermotoga sp.]HBF10850.1 hypothetical protein [Thermotoga neapolitana]ACM22701.1 Putative uncharacterized protein [Thermotoga neapolitana DSM 4359]AJG40647.1 hypothetical protein TRQ7_04150 [Thermotoga sp. RQ7]KFZ22328.1 hypothetical protein LA10_02637 [Thermotoga neapolitana LA10]